MTSELLKRVAACAPKEMGALYRGGCVTFLNLLKKQPSHGYPVLYASNDPLVNAEAMVAMWAQLEKDGWEWVMATKFNATGVCGHRMETTRLSMGPKRHEGTSATMILAVTNAFLAVYEEQT